MSQAAHTKPRFFNQFTLPFSVLAENWGTLGNNKLPFCFVAFVATVIVKLVSAAKGYDPATVILTVLPPVAILATWLYFAVLESSSWQATLGKKLLGLYVTDIKGQRLSLSRATGRTFAKFLSSMTAGIGYLLCGFTEKKQALHDMVAGCLVLRGSR